MAPPEAAAALLGITTREVYQRVEKGTVHFMETEGRELLICCRLGPNSRRQEQEK
jgi:hypothetical protein